MVVAGTNFNPRAGDAYDRFAQVIVGEAHRFEHGTRRGPVRSCGNGIAVLLQVRHRLLFALHPGEVVMMGSRYKKEPPVVRAALCFYSGVLVLHSHLCHPNRNYILNNKDDNKDDNKGEIQCTHGL